MEPIDPRRNAAAHPSDNEDEMLRRSPLDASTAEAVLRGRGDQITNPESAEVVRFAAAVKQATDKVEPQPSPALRAVMERGIPVETPAPAVAASHGLHPPPRRRPMIAFLTSKLAALSLVAKAGIASAAVVASGTAAGAAGALPDTLQTAFDAGLRGSVEQPVEVPAELPGEREVPAPALNSEPDGNDMGDEPHSDLPSQGGEPTQDAEPPEPSEFGRDVADQATNNEGVDGLEVANDASDSRLPEHVPGPPSSPPAGPSVSPPGPAVTPPPAPPVDTPVGQPDSPVGPPEVTPPTAGPPPTAPPVDTPTVNAPPVDAPPVDAPPVTPPAGEAPSDESPDAPSEPPATPSAPPAAPPSGPPSGPPTEPADPPTTPERPADAGSGSGRP